MRFGLRALCCALIMGCFLLPARAETGYPACQGVVSDWAGVIGGQTAQDLEALSDRLCDQIGGRLYIAARHFLGGADAKAYAAGVFSAWELGEEDGLLLLVIGEESYALHLGERARALLPADGQLTLLAGQLRTPFLARDYDGALTAFAPAYATALAKAEGVSVSLSGLFGQAEQAVQSTASPVADSLWQSMFGQDISDGENWPQEQQEEEKRLNGRSLLIWALVIYFLFFRKKGKAKKRMRFDFGHRPGRRW